MFDRRERPSSANFLANSAARSVAFMDRVYLGAPCLVRLFHALPYLFPQGNFGDAALPLPPQNALFFPCGALSQPKRQDKNCRANAKIRLANDKPLALCFLIVHRISLSQQTNVMQKLLAALKRMASALPCSGELPPVEHSDRLRPSVA